tara:strand:+ start:2196 stop:2348 length:153 start_codon:yes stop_codon:yes gene_type:complete
MKYYYQILLKILVLTLFISPIFIKNSISAERTEKEKKLGVFKEEIIMVEL